MPYTNETTTRRSTIITSTITQPTSSPTSSTTGSPTGSTASKQTESTTKPGTGPTQSTAQPGTTRTPIQPVCPSDYCLNGGTCQYTLDFGFRCKCPTGYIGLKCSEKVGEKNSNNTSLILGILIPGLMIAGFLGFIIYRFNQVNNFKDIFK